MRIILAYNKGDHPCENQECYATALRNLGHIVDVWHIGHPNIPKTGYSLGIQVDCCDNMGFPLDVRYPTIYYAFDNWQNPTNFMQPDYIGDGKFIRDNYYVPRARVASLVFSMSYLGSQNYACNGIESRTITIGADSRLKRYPRSSDFLYDVSAACNFWNMGHLPNERERLSSLIQSQEGLKTAIGSGVGYWDIPNLYNTSKMVWNYSPCGFDVLNYRVFEALISGSMLLTNTRPTATLNAIGYRDGEHYVSYDNDTDLIDKIKYYSNNIPERNRIAMNGHLLTLKAHTMEIHMKIMLDVASGKVLER